MAVTDRRTAVDWAQVIKELVDVRYPDAEAIVLVQDNLNTHTPGSLYEAFPPAEAKRLADKLELHYTPKHGSWLNTAEIELSILSRQCLNRRIPDKATLQREVAAWAERRNAAGGTVDWRFTTDDARIKLKRLYPKIHASQSTRSRRTAANRTGSARHAAATLSRRLVWRGRRSVRGRCASERRRGRRKSPV